MEVAINEKQCERIARIVKKLKFRQDFLKREILTFTKDKETKTRVYFYATAICHQTRKLRSEKRNLVGWDYLTKVFIELSKNEPSFLEPKNLKLMNKEKLVNKLKMLYSDYNDLDHTTLDRVEERAEFLIDCAKILDDKYVGSVLNLLDKSEGFLIKNNNGMYALLEQFKAYSDPLRKKSGVFLEFLINSGLFKVKDPENFVPIIDYHMQRVLLRMGCIEINDEELRKKIINFEKIDLDKQFRKTAQESLRIISKISGKGVVEFDAIFWSLGRSCCQIKTILCRDRVCDKTPCTFFDYIDLDKHDRCVFEDVCKGSLDENYRKLKEPNVDTHFY